METNRNMGRSACWLVGFVCTAMTPIAFGAEETKVSPRSGRGAVQSPTVSVVDYLGPDDIVDLPAPLGMTTHVYKNGGGVSSQVVVPEKLIYSNKFGPKMLRFNQPNRRYADDIITDSVNGCNLTRYVVVVNGGVVNGSGEFACKTALFDTCPPIHGGGTMIPGTEGDFQGLSDDINFPQVLVVDVSDLPIPIPPTVWVQVECDSGLAGWVGAAPADLGFTQDRYSHPAGGCDSRLGPKFYAGFYLQIFAEDQPAMPCETHFVAYAATSPTLPSLNCGAGQPCADDFLTILAPSQETCILSAYEVGMRGTSGAFTMKLELSGPGSSADFPIIGTEFEYVGIGDNRLEVARHLIDPNLDIEVPITELRVKWEADKSGTGLINARFPAAGFSRDPFFIRNMSMVPAFWQEIFANPRAAVYLIVYCRGDTPRGACCKNQLTGIGQPLQCVDDLPVTACPAPGRWLKDKTCADPNAFDPPCGEHACCLDTSCEDRTFAQCASFIDPSSLGIPCISDPDCPGRVCQGVAPNRFCSPRTGVWQNNGGFCDPAKPPGIPFECARYQCYYANTDCFAAVEELCCGPNFPQFQCELNMCPPGTKCLESPEGICNSGGGCNNLTCCDLICTSNPYCCDVAWDEGCVNAANNAAMLPIPDCHIAPGNDTCANDSSVAIGAQDISITPILPNPGDPPTNRFQGFKVADNSLADASLADPLACCNKAGVDARVAGTLWYKFVMPTVAPPNQPTTARLHTCFTADSAASDAVLAVYSVGDLSSEAAACSSLGIIACNDDRENCGSNDLQADICVENLQGGETYYVMLGASNAGFLGQYSLDVEIPCTRVLPPNNTCRGTESLPQGLTTSATFDTLNATLDCPAEDCVNALKNDLWYDYTVPSCLGSATIETCGDPNDPNNDDPPTSIVVYRVPNPEIDTCALGSVVGCNDNALVNTAEHTRRPQTCAVSGIPCDTQASCQLRCNVSGDPCTTVADCHHCDLQPGRPCNDNTQCLTCFFDNPATPSTLESCTVQSTGPTLECPQVGDFCRSLPQNSCIKPNDNLATMFMEECLKEACLSSCGEAASVTIPVRPGELYKVRMGGDFGAEVDGVLKVTCVPQNCNNNSKPDLEEIQMNPALDCNENEQIDSCEITAQPSRDCNNNGKIDVCEIDQNSPAPGGPFFCTSNCTPDCNLNGRPDSCDIASCSTLNLACKDCNNNMRPDSCDIADGTSMDCNANMKPDSCDIASCPTATPACKDCNSNMKPDSCDIASQTSMDADMNGVPDECVTCNTITASADCSIDVLQPHDLKNAMPPLGITTLDLMMNAGCTASNLSASITVSTVSAQPPAGPVPSFSVSGMGNMATITFTPPIPPGNWTCVSLTAAPAQKVCLGFLPGDVSDPLVSITTDTTDTDDLVKALNNMAPLPLPRTDMNRTGILTAEDLIAHMNLLNGADAFIPWLAQSLPACP